MFPFFGIFGQTPRMFHSPEIDELRDALTAADKLAADEPSATVTELPERATRQSEDARRAA